MRALVDPAIDVDIPSFGITHVVPTWGWRGRCPQRHIIWLATGGECGGSILGQPVSLRGGDLLWFSPGATHDFGVYPGRERARLHHFNLIIRDRGRDLRLKDDFVKQEGAWDLVADFAALIEEMAVPWAFSEQRRRAMLVLIFSSVFAHTSETPAELRAFTRSERRRLLGYVDENIADRPTPAALAAALGLSPDYFSRVFRTTFGCAPRVWLVRERIRRAAAAMLEYRMPAKQIAAMFGYDDIVLFTRQFKGIMGVSPGLYRRRGERG